MEFEKEIVVLKNMTAEAMKTGSLKVFSTASLVSLVEYACFEELEKIIDSSYTTVGIKLDLNHLKASPIGIKVKAKIKLIKQEDKKYTFGFEVYDEKDLISNGYHERYLVNIDKFMSKVNNKINN